MSDGTHASTGMRWYIEGRPGDEHVTVQGFVGPRYVFVQQAKPTPTTDWVEAFVVAVATNPDKPKVPK